MKLPISSKKDAIDNILFLGIVVIFSPLIFHELVYTLLPVYIIISGTILICSIFYLRKKNIKCLRYSDKILTVRWNRKVFEIPAQRIKGINKGIGGIDIRFRMTIKYKIVFKDTFPFGNSIYLTYASHNTTKEFIEEDPYEIKVLKDELRFDSQ